MKKLLRKMTIFMNCEEEYLQGLAKIAAYKQYSKGSIICEEGQLCDALYLISSGRVATIERMSGHDIPTSIFEKESILGKKCPNR